jgi:hypothetical protein
MINDAIRMRLVPAIKVIDTGEVRIGRRGVVHSWATYGTQLLENGAGWQWLRGYYDPRTKQWFDIDDVPGGIHDGETETARTIREMRGAS